MVEIEPAINTVTETIYVSYIASTTRGTAVITNHNFFGTPQNLDLSDVTDGSFTTVLTRTYSVEDVGIVDVLSVPVFIRTVVNGNGTFRWQISGDGGSNWTTIINQAFNVGVFTNVTRSGSGQWITSINTGTDKLQLRLQALANAGTVNLRLDDGSSMFIQYRQKLRSTD